MSILKEFKEFAVKGNMVDLAVGIIIGGAFGKVVSSIVSDLLMPPLGYLIGGINFTDIKIHLKAPAIDLAGKAAQEVTINIGNFIQSLVDLTIIALAVFLIVKAINTLNRKMAAQKDAVDPAAPPPPPTKDQELLMEIRDLLKKK
jgi:large conductance mechanosensitive channel